MFFCYLTSIIVEDQSTLFDFLDDFKNDIYNWLSFVSEDKTLNIHF